MSVLKYVTDGDNAADNEDAHSIERKCAMRLYGFIGCSIFNHGFCISLVSAFVTAWFARLISLSALETKSP